MKERDKTIRVINVRACRGVGDRKWAERMKEKN